MGCRGRTSTLLIGITDDDNKLKQLRYKRRKSSIAFSKGSKQAAEGDSEYLPEDKLQEICEKHYKQILPIMTEKLHREKLQGVQTRLAYDESSHRNSRTREETQFSESELRREGDKPTRRRSPVSTTVFTRHASERRSVSSNRSAEDPNRRKKDARSLIHSYVTCSSERQRDIEEEWHAADYANRMQPARTKEAYFSKDENDQCGHWKSRPKKHSSNGEDDLSQPWLCKETDPFTARIWYFEVPKRTRMPTNVNMYDGTGDPKYHLNFFQAAAKIERWAMPTWYHMFNSTLIGSARVWFDKLPPESINNYEMLRKAFLGNFSQQKKYIKDPVEIHHIKQKKGESTEAFMERFKAESMHVNRALECIKISGFMHGITNPDLIKKIE
ncbi:reverse transcriptase domain-containing protein [Tanacetum coccineum]